MDRQHSPHQATKSLILPATTHQDHKQFEVICRVRPLQPAETASDIAISPNSKTITIQSQAKNSSKEFTFHKIYEENTTQADFTCQISETIFNNCRSEGKGSLVLSYGVTNSGKTYTILGTQEEPGLLPVLVERIEKDFPQEIINITAIEIYNDQFFSLKDKQKLYPKQCWGTYQFSDYQPEKITKISTKAMMRQYMINRNQTDTHSNKKSSRSHAIFKIECDQVSIAIVDLAGSERLSKANSNIQETSSINGSLLVLGKCIHAFRDNTKIPFRECKLTKALTQYFTPTFKIYMIAHINRSGQMFHENLKVLEYAAISSMVKPINLQANRSIFKSVAKKKKSMAAKSAMKYKMTITSDDEDDKLQIKSCHGNKKKDLKKEQIQISPEMKQLEEVMDKADKKRRRTFMEKYLNQMIGRMKQFDYYLDRQFEKENESDRKFISEMQSCVYESPSKKIKTGYQIKQAQARIQLRKQILQELQEQKIELKRDATTSIGPSMKKCLQQSLKKDIERQIRMNLVQQNQEHEKKQQIEKLQIKVSEDEQKQISNNGQPEQVQIEEDSLTTPIKIDFHNEQSQSFFKRAMNNPNIILQSGFKVIKTAGEAFNTMIDSFTKIVHENKKNPNRDLRHVVKTIQRLAFCKPQSLNINYTGSLQCANKQDKVQKREIKKVMLKQFDDGGVGSGNVKQMNVQKMEFKQFNEIGINVKESNFKKIVLKEFNERGVGSGNVKQLNLFENKEKTLCQMMKQLDGRSETNDQDSRPQSLAFSIIQSIPESRESEQFYDRNSPFFQIPEQPKQQQEHHHQIAQKPLIKGKKQSQHGEVSKDYEEITFKNGGIKGAPLQSQQSMPSSRKNGSSQQSYEFLKKSKNTNKTRYNRKPLKQTTQMEFVVNQKRDISPLKTRTGRVVSQTK